MSRHTKISQGLKNHGAYHSWHVSANTRAALSLALSALLVFTSLPTPALHALAEEVTPQVEVADVTDGQELDDAAQAEETSPEFVDEQGDDESQNAAEGGQDAPAEAEPAGEDAEPAADDETDEETEPAEETLDEAGLEAENAPTAAAKAPTGLRRAPAASNSGATIVHQGINNPVNLNMDLFDYWITSQDANDRDGRNAGYTGTGGVVNEGINKEHLLLFHGGASGAHPSGNGADNFTGMDSGATINGKVEPYTGPSMFWGPVIQGIVKNELVKGYPVLSDNTTRTFTVIDSEARKSGKAAGSASSSTQPLFRAHDNAPNNENLAYLFDPKKTNVEGRASYPDVNGLLSVDTEGYYIYDSGFQTAKLNESTSRFELGRQSGSDAGFWPLDSHKEQGAAHNDYYGMHMSTSFSMPAGGKVLNPRGEYVPMTFTFSGDDDVWVFIDGVLVGDVGGIHQPSSLQIDFQTGKVQINRNFDKCYQPSQGNRTSDPDGKKYPEYVADTTIRAMFRAAGQEEKATWSDDTFADSSYHTIDFFYLERGNNESNLLIRFNMINTADFMAHKSLVGTGDTYDMHNKFQFELVGLNGKYKKNTDGSVTKIDDSQALRPVDAGKYTNENASAVDGDVSRYYHDESDRWVYRVGVAADGNVNFGNAAFSGGETDDIGDTYHYIIREVSSTDSTINADDRVYYMEATVALDAKTQEKYLQKTYYADETFTTKVTDTKFANFVNLTGDAPSAEPEVSVSKTLVYNAGTGEQKLRINQGQFSFEAVDTMDRVVAECGVSNDSTGEAQATLTLPRLTPVDFFDAKGERVSEITREYTIREVLPEGAELKDNGKYVLNGISYDRAEYTASYTASYDGNTINTTKPALSRKDGGSVTNISFRNEVVSTSLTVTKEWDCPGSAKPTEAIVVKLVGSDNSARYATLGPDELTYTFDDLPINGTTYTVVEGTGTVTDETTANFTPFESPENGFDFNDKRYKQVSIVYKATADAEISGTDGIPGNVAPFAGTATITNQALTQVKVIKTWKGVTPDSSIVIKLTSTDENPRYAELNASDWAYTFENLPVKDDRTYTVIEGTGHVTDGSCSDFQPFDTTTANFNFDGKTYRQKSLTYKDAGDAVQNDGLTCVSPDSGTAAIVNEALTKVEVEKVWENGSAKQPIIVRLDPSDTNLPTQYLELNEGTWSGSFDNLVVKSGLTYTVTEGTGTVGADGKCDNFTALGNTYTVGTTKMKQVSTKYYTDADKTTEAGAAKLDGSISPYGGKAVITNGPVAAKVQLKKVQSADHSKVIAGVTFTLKVGESFDTAQEVVKEQHFAEGSPYTTDDNGTVNLGNLRPGTYWLVETSAPDGYIPRPQDDPIQLVVSDEGTLLIGDNIKANSEYPRPSVTLDSDGVYTLEVPNVLTYALPSAGGPGVYPFLLVGAFAATYAARDAAERRKSPAQPKGRHGRHGGL